MNSTSGRVADMKGSRFIYTRYVKWMHPSIHSFPKTRLDSYYPVSRSSMVYFQSRGKSMCSVYSLRVKYLNGRVTFKINPHVHFLNTIQLLGNIKRNWNVTKLLLPCSKISCYGILSGRGCKSEHVWQSSWISSKRI